MNINNNLLNEKINQLKKGLEIVGANENLYNKTNDEIINDILDMAFKGELDSLIRKYKKTRGLEEYNKIYASINKTYRLDINKLVLSSVNNIENITDLDEQEHLYGEYLNQKRKQIVDGVVSKVGIV